MTRDLQERLEAQWPELATRLRRYLLRTGVRSGRVDDIVQETAARLVSMWEQVDPQRPTWPLVKTIALNLLRDEARRRYDEVPSELPDMPLPHDHEGSLMAHLDLSRVRVALKEMSPAHRAVLLAEAGVPSHLPGVGSDAEKMMRMRARRRLKELVKKLPALLPARLRLLEAGQLLGGLKDLAVPGIACLACVALYPSLIVPPGVAAPPAAPAHQAAAPLAIDALDTATADLAFELSQVRAGGSSTGSAPRTRHAEPSSEAPSDEGSSALPEVPETPSVPGYEGMPMTDEADAVAQPDTEPELPELPNLPLPETGLDLEMGL